MKDKKVGRLAVNSRISIDYTQKKPKIKFQYPRKNVEDQVGRTMIVVISTLALTAICVISIICLFLFAMDNYLGQMPDPTNCSSSFINTNFTYVNNSIYKMQIFCDNGFNKTYIWNTGFNNPKNNNLLSKTIHGLSGLGANLNGNFKEMEKETANYATIITLTLSYVILMSLMFVCHRICRKIFAKSKFLSSTIPKTSDKISFSRGTMAKFSEVPENKIIEIPLFRNIKLNYRATKDFSKYLERFEIKEHPFMAFIKKKGKVKKEKNVYLWYARFYFKEQPKSGFLEVLFK